jgi:hypothetical protein
MHMFLRRDYRNQAIGLVAAFALLITGVIVTGAVAKPAGNEPRPAVLAESPDGKGASECLLAHRPEQAVPVC